MDYKKFVYLVDTHWGYERRGGHKVARHDPKAIDVALQFVQDFKPNIVILGGDNLDCYPIGPHDKNKPGEKEGLRLIEDAEECVMGLIKPLIDMKAQQYHYITGNHEGWLRGFELEHPGLSGMLSLERLLGLPSGWNVLPKGGSLDVGKLTFIHGDQLRGGEHIAKAAVTDWERNIRFGHLHTYQVYTKTRPQSTKLGKTGIAVPCLCTRNQTYLLSHPNRWVQGFNYGYIFKDGTFNDYVPIITDNKVCIDGKVYKA